MYTSTKFSQFTDVGAPVAGDKAAGLRNGVNVLLDIPAVPTLPFVNLLVDQVLVPNEIYNAINVAPRTYTLPAVIAAGQTISIINSSVSTFVIAQNAGQQIQFGNVETTGGVAGSIGSNNVGDSLTLICIADNTFFSLLGGPQGNWVIV